MGKRAHIPPRLQAEVLLASRRRCCICFFVEGDATEKLGQIAHIDHDCNNNALDNLAFLCLRHHSLVDSTTSQAKNFTEIEIKQHRALLLQHFAIAGEPDRVHLQLKVDLPFSNFTEGAEKEFLATLQKLMTFDGAILVKDRRRGCTKLTIEVSLGQSEEILALHKAGRLRQLRVMTVVPANAPRQKAARRYQASSTVWQEEREMTLRPDVISAMDGDRSAFDRIVTDLWNPAIAFVTRQFGLSQEDTEDVVLLAFVTAWTKLSMLKAPEFFRAWFFSILRRHAITTRRLSAAASLIKTPDKTLSRDMPFMLLDVVDAATTPDPGLQFVRRESVRIVRDKLENVYSRLSESHKAVFLSSFVNAQNETSAAKLTRLPVGAIRSATKRIRTLLRNELKTEDLSHVPEVELRIAVAEAFATWLTPVKTSK